MLFNSVEFIFLFLPITLFIFFQIGMRGYHRWAIAWLVAASLFFYGWWNPAYLVLLTLSILFNYGIGYGLSQSFTDSARKKLLLGLGIAVNLSLIGYFKYANFFVSTFNDITGTTFNLYQVILPLGISFFTFEQITFLVDVYRGITKEANLLNYSLFVTFFPRLIAGPIILHRETIPQFANKSIYKFNLEDIAVGITIFSIGLSKKLLIADNVALYATPVFQAAAHGTALTFYDGWSGALFYTFQLYFDFSGYSDMAIGAARMFGIKLPLNFNSPYKAVNIIDFWRRWHITLSNFLRDYLYIPLGGSRQGEWRRSINLMITMLLGGLWHGAGYTFILWGGLHGIYLTINHQWRSWRKSLGHDLKKTHWWSVGLSGLVTFIAVVVGWVLFRAENLTAAIAILKSMIGANGFSFSPSVVEGQKKLLIFVCLLVWLAPNTQQLLRNYHPALHLPKSETLARWEEKLLQMLQWRFNTTFGVLLGILAFIVVKTILNAPESEFLYFNF